MGNLISLPFKVAKTTATFYGGLFHYLFRKRRTTPYELDSDAQCSDSDYFDFLISILVVPFSFSHALRHGHCNQAGQGGSFGGLAARRRDTQTSSWL